MNVQGQYAQWKEAMKKIEYVEKFKENLDKRLVEIMKEHDEAVALNGIMRGQRNHFDKLVKVLCITQTMPTRSACGKINHCPLGLLLKA